MKRVDQELTLVGACRKFISRINEMVEAGGGVLYEACWIEADDIIGMMNIPAIGEFSRSIGLLKEDGSLSDTLTHEVSPEQEREIFKKAFRGCLGAHLDDIFGGLSESLSQIREDLESLGST